ncbi:MAG: universal stress protein [Pseudomonadota bacterium]|nr:universal stress protein [Pseudomonadota bacterium]
MFKRILLPTDGSELSLRAVDVGIDLARSLGAGVYGFHVIPPTPALAYFADVALADGQLILEQTEAFAKQCLDAIRQRAEKAGVEYAGDTVVDQRPSSAIVAASQKHACDLIVMASHGWQGLDRVLLGSATHKVILLGMVPVLVVR